MVRKIRRADNIPSGPRVLQMHSIIDPELQEQQSVKRTSALVHIGESPLTWLYSHGHLTQRQLLAGERLRLDYERSNIAPRVTMNWDALKTGRLGSSSGMDGNISDRISTAKDRFDIALRILGRDLSDIAWRVVCAGEAIAGAERYLGWPVRSGKLVLRIALDRLADHYRLPE
jgi:Domain of unknown function (DUF6456)